MKRLLAVGLLLGVLAAARAPAADGKEKAEAKEALKALQEFIGAWKGSGGPDKPRPAPRDPIWSETLSWGWRFKGDDAWLVMEVKNGKYLKGGELRYLTDKKKYQFTAAFADGKTGAFEGDLKNDVLTVERTDPDTKQVTGFGPPGGTEASGGFTMWNEGIVSSTEDRPTGDQWLFPPGEVPFR